MAIVHKSFKYDGVPSASAITTIKVNFKVPSFEFNTRLINGKPLIERDLLREEIIAITKKISDTNYEANYKNEYLIGSSDTSILNFLSYMAQIGFTNTQAGLLNSLLTEIHITINDESKNLVGKTSMEAFYCLSTASKKYKGITRRQVVQQALISYNVDASDKLKLELVDYARNNIFLINKDTFAQVAEKFKTAEPQFNDYALLYIISHVTDISSGKPKIKIDAEEINVFLKTYFGIDQSERVQAILRLINEDLYDFPITVPELRTIEIKGTFKINTGANPVSLNDFGFYTLSVEYSEGEPGDGIRHVSEMFDWKTIQASQIVINKIPFSFAPVLTNLISSNIQVRVNGYDGSEVWQKEYASTDQELQKLNIEVLLLKPVVLSSTGEPKPVNGNKKLSGKIIEMSGDCRIKDVTIVLQAKKTGDVAWRIVGAATTDASGNFSIPYPYGNYTAAQALVSLIPDSPAVIPVHTDQVHIAANETIADDFLYLLVQGVECGSMDNKDEDDCGCHDEKKANRLPDQKELLASDSYTQDIGGSCINLSIPNRTLNEYSHTAVVRTSDPDVANYILTKDVNGNFKLEGGITKIDRKPVDLSNPIYWQDAPDDHNNLSLYQAVKVATGHVLHYSVVTKADGYSMGELLYSLPLAPGQKKQIVMFEQAHSLQGSETQRVSQRESLAASLINDVDITDTIVGNISENTRGSSSATTSGVSGGFGLAGIIDAVGISLGISGGVANANSKASQNSSRAMAAYFHERMRNSITQNAQSYREMNATVITTVQEGQQYGVTSEVIANHNHCHSLTMMYFEVLRHYAIYQELSYVEECLFIPLLMTDFTRENVYKWRDVLAKHLLPMASETYLQPFAVLSSGRQHPLLRGFDAIERIKTNYANVDFPIGAYDDEIIHFITGEMDIQTNLPRPKTVFDRIKSWPVIEKEEGSNWSWKGAVAGAILAGPLGAIAGGIFAADGVTIKLEAEKIINEYITIDANFRSVPPARSIRVIKFDTYFFEVGGLDKDQWIAYANLLSMPSVYDMLSYYFKDRLISEWDNIFYNDLAPVLFDKIVEKIRIGTFSALDFSSERKYKGGNSLMRINLRGTGSNKKRNEIQSLKIELINLPGLTNELITLNVIRLAIRYSTSHYNGILYSGGLGNDDLIDGTEIFTPENANEKRNPRMEDAYIAQKLIEHLNSNLEHYNKWLWRELDKDRLYMLLDGFNIETYNDFGQPIGSRSLASVVKNELVGIAGNSLIMPVAPGYKIDRTFIVEQPVNGTPREIDLLDHYKPLIPIPAYRISLSSRGVFGEAVQGACDACEKVKDNTSQNWDKFKTDEPTAISPVTVPVPTVTDWKAAFKEFATPMINIQNAPAAPAPGAGLAAAGLTDLLGKSDIFKDITGLDQNQKNAVQTYLSNQENAKAFAEMAKVLSIQGHNTEHSDKIVENIRNSPELSREEKAQLLKDHFGQIVDGGQAKKEDQKAAQNNKPSLTDAAVKAADQGKPVKASSANGDGKLETVEIGAGTSNNFRVPGKKVPLILQGNKPNACWAAAAAMMMSWKDGKNYTIEEVLSMVPTEYFNKYNNNQPLLSTEKLDFIQALKMVAEPPASYTFNTYLDWMKTFGPLWITVDSDSSTNISPHAKILIGYDGDGTENNSQFVFLDPALNGEQKQSYSDFLNEYEAMVIDLPSGNLFVQIIHFEEEVLGEGRNAAVTTDARVLDLMNYKPVDADTIVINKMEFKTGITGITNYKNWDTDATVLHNMIPSKHKTYREPKNVTFLVLHETASDVGKGYYDKENETSHMAVLADSTILQFNDLIEIESHTIGMSDVAVGIEFVNRSWLSHKKKYADDGTTLILEYDYEGIVTEAALTSAQKSTYAEANGYLWTFWGDNFNIYRVPQSVPQLEKAVELVKWLTIDLNVKIGEIAAGGTGIYLFFPSILNKWLQLVSYNDVKDIWTFKDGDIPAEEDKSKPIFFIFTTGYGFLEPSPTLKTKSGILSHNACKDNHVDGSFLSLYTWLRIEKGKTSMKAYELSKSLMKDHHLVATLTGSRPVKRIHLIDVNDGNLV